jgi:hypothetical protein
MSASTTLLLEPLSIFLPASHQQGMKFAFKIKTEPMTQAAVIIGVIAFALGSLVTIAIYVDSPIVGISCAVALVVIV